MGRSLEFDERTALDAAMRCFWHRGYEASSVRNLADAMGISGASLYNTFGDKRGLYRRALEHYLDRSSHEAIARLEKTLPPRQAISSFFAEVIQRDPKRRGCLLVNSALEVAPHDAELRKIVIAELGLIEHFFRRCADAGQRAGTITKLHSAEALGRVLLGVLLGIRVMARTAAEPEALSAMARAAMEVLDS